MAGGFFTVWATMEAPSSLTRDQAQAPQIMSSQSEPPDHQRSPFIHF